MGNILLQLGPPLQVLYVVFISLVETKFFVDACIWDEFLVTAAVLERSTLAFPHWLIPRFFFLVDEIILFVLQTHPIEVSGSRRTELTRSCQGPPLKSEWQKVGSNSVPTAPEARTLPILHAPLLDAEDIGWFV